MRITSSLPALSMMSAFALAACGGAETTGFSNPDAASDILEEAAEPVDVVAIDVRDARVDARIDAAVTPDVARDVQVRDTPPFDVPPPMGMSLDYVLTGFVIEDDGAGAAPNPNIFTSGVAGFNLDGRFTGGAPRDPSDCGHGDFFSTLDPDQNMGRCTAGSPRGGSSCTGGVDNQLPDIADLVGGFGNDIRMSIRELVGTGRIAVLVRIYNVDGTPSPTLDDDQVTVLVFPIARPMFARCSMTGTPGAMYAIDDESLTRAGDPLAARYRFNARIVRGRLVTTPTMSSSPDFAIPVPLVGGEPVAFQLLNTQLRADLTIDRATSGNLGGYTPLRSVVMAVSSIVPAGIPEATVASIIQSFVDVQDPPGDPMGCFSPNGGIALGMGFAATRVVVAPGTVRGAVDGMCGSL